MKNKLLEQFMHINERNETKIGFLKETLSKIQESLEAMEENTIKKVVQGEATLTE